MRNDPTIDAVDWTSLRDELTSRGLLQTAPAVGAPDWRDAGKIAYALGPRVTTLCLNRDCRQFAIAFPPDRHTGDDVLILAPEHADRVREELASAFDEIQMLPPAAIRHARRTPRSVSVFRGQHLRAWPP
jgi:hypothetical protein